MSASDFDKYPKELQEKIRLSREAFEIAARLNTKLEEHFRISDLNVAAIMEKRLVISGHVKTDAEREEIIRFTNNEMPDWHLIPDLHVSPEL